MMKMLISYDDFIYICNDHRMVVLNVKTRRYTILITTGTPLFFTISHNELINLINDKTHKLQHPHHLKTRLRLHIFEDEKKNALYGIATIEFGRALCFPIRISENAIDINAENVIDFEEPNFENNYPNMAYDDYFIHFANTYDKYTTVPDIWIMDRTR